MVFTWCGLNEIELNEEIKNERERSPNKYSREIRVFLKATYEKRARPPEIPAVDSYLTRASEAEGLS